eukprot:TRINITY_DN11450_c0_g1_i4.p1 TRINITY_DN11450_c0_g1~~TRINITY_DN11450_c0_g1_i4.p1  ORF type:complete len:677 (+),score=115.39 TRINITY_DN11450_c0_g1_i4:3-2033(+)
MAAKDTDAQSKPELANEGAATDELDRIVYTYLQKKNYKASLDALSRESRVHALNVALDPASQAAVESSVSTRLASFASYSTPKLIEDSYTNLKSWISTSLDQYKNELYTVTYPIFVHCFFELLYKGDDGTAQRFMNANHGEHINLHRTEVESLKRITRLDQLESNETARAFRNNKYNLSLSSYSFELLLAFVQEHRYMSLLRIINQHLDITVFSGKPASLTQQGGLGDASNVIKSVNADRSVSWGTLALPDGIDDDEPAAKPDDKGDKDKSKSDKSKDDDDSAPKRKRRKDHDKAPKEHERLKFPPVRGPDAELRRAALKEARNRVALGPEQLPSCCAYTMFNAQGVTVMTFTRDNKVMATGHSDSSITVWSLTPDKLKAFLPADKLSEVDITAHTQLGDLQDDSTASETKTLIGHSGAIFGLSFSPDQLLLLSCSEDRTIRLWSLATYTCVVCYQGHNYPVWDVKFSPMGLYFASASHDRTARLWSTEKIFPLRIFAGHLSDVDVVEFHPNCNYVATGSTDKSCRLWDVHTGECVRIFQGHRDTVHALTFSSDGRFLASGADDWSIMLWDLEHGTRVSVFQGHQHVIFSLAFSQDDSVLASGGMDDSVRIWDCSRLNQIRSALGQVKEVADELEPGQASQALLTTYHTKNTPVFALQFGVTNYLICGGVYRATDS